MDNNVQRSSEECMRVSKLMSEALKNKQPEEARRIFYEWRHQQEKLGWNAINQDSNNF